MIIRRANLADFDDLKVLFNEVHKLHVEGEPLIFRDSDVLPLERFEKLLESEFIFVCETDGRVIGFLESAFLFKGSDLTFDRKELHLCAACVDKRFRKQGVATKLIKAATDFAKENDCNVLSLNFWHFNDVARESWNSLGFEVTNIHMMKRL